MSLVQRLRMAGIFPGRNMDLGDASIEKEMRGPDPMYDVIKAGKQLFDYNNRMQPRGIDMIRPSNGQSTMNGGNGNVQQEPRLKFGGVVGEQSNPGAGILARAGQNAERIWDDYKKPINPQPDKGPSNDEQNLEDYFERKNKETLANANADNASNKGWKVGNTIGPDGTPISVRYNEKTGQTEPLNMSGPLVNKETPGAIQKRADAKVAAANANKAYLDKTSDSLTLIKDLMDDNDNLTPEGARATGVSSVGNYIPFTQGYSGSTKINKLRSEQVLNLIGQLKAQSKTGATGMGNMSNKDLGVIEKAATLLNTSLPEEEFRKQLKIVKDELKDIQLRLTKGDDISNESSNMKPVSSHAQSGKIRVRDKATGKTGFMSEGAFNPAKYDRVQ